jgi:hypothetical protein
MNDEIVDRGKREFFKEAFSFLGNTVGEIFLLGPTVLLDRQGL